MKFPVLEPLRLNGQRYKIGGNVELDPKADLVMILRLVREGVIRDVRPTISTGAGNVEQRNDSVNDRGGQGDAPDGDTAGAGDPGDGAGTADLSGGETADAVAAAGDGAAQAAGEQPSAPADKPAAPATKAPAKAATKTATKTPRRARR